MQDDHNSFYVTLSRVMDAGGDVDTADTAPAQVRYRGACEAWLELL